MADPVPPRDPLVRYLLTDECAGVIESPAGWLYRAAEVDAEYAALRSDLAACRAQLDDHKAANESLGREVDRLEGQLTDAEAALLQTQQERDALQVRLDVMRLARDEQVEIVVGVTKVATQRREALRRLQGQIRTLVSYWRAGAIGAGQWSVECQASEESEHAATAAALTKCADELSQLVDPPSPAQEENR